jgi:pilus assembly protein Flp/PilA
MLVIIGENSMLKHILAYLKDEDGQTSTEYILLVAVVALIVFKFKSVAEVKLDEIAKGVFGNAESFVEQLDGQGN